MAEHKKRTPGEDRRAPRLTVAPGPHMNAVVSARGMFGDVLIALAPALAVSTYFFGPRVLTLSLVSMAAAVAFELLYQFATRRQVTVSDLSALVTGLLLAMCLPVTAPYWTAVVGAGFAILLVKQLYGGLGNNFLNPALAGRVFLLSFPLATNLFALPGVDHWADWAGTGADAALAASPMAALQARVIPVEFSVRQLLLGQRGGPMGEVAAFALILGGLYLLIRGVIRPRIPLYYLGTVAALTYLFPFGNDPVQWMLYQLLGGGLLLGAIFMATDCATSPVTPRGQAFYGVGCGVLTVFLRYFGTYPDGVWFAILAMNVCTWLFDLAGRPHRFGAPWFPKLRKKKGVD